MVERLSNIWKLCKNGDHTIVVVTKEGEHLQIVDMEIGVNTDSGKVLLKTAKRK